MSPIARQSAIFASAIRNGDLQRRTYASNIPIRKYKVQPLEDARPSAMFINASNRSNFLRHPVRKRSMASNALRLAQGRSKHSKMKPASETNSSEEIPGIATETTFTAPRAGEVDEEAVPDIKARPPLEWERQRMIVAAHQRQNTGFIRALQHPARRPALHSKTIRKHRVYMDRIYQDLCDGTKLAPALPMLAMDFAQWQITAEDHRSRGKPLFIKAQKMSLLELDVLEDDLVRISQGMLQALEQVRSFKDFVGSLEGVPLRERDRRKLPNQTGDGASPPNCMVQKSEHLPQSTGEFTNYNGGKDEVEADSESHLSNNVVSKAEHEFVEADSADLENDSRDSLASKADQKVISKYNLADDGPEAELERANWELEYMENLMKDSGIEP